MILKPDFNVETLFDIDYKELKASGTNVILFDLDSTIMPSKSGAYPPSIVDLLKELKLNFIIAVVSNNKNKGYIAKVQSISDFEIIGHANKPSSKVMKKYLKTINATPQETVVIGDRPLTDILAGKLLGAKTILVDSITKDTEKPIVRVVRQLERLTIKR